MSEDIEPTNSEILNAINEFANKVETRFSGVDKRLYGIEQVESGLGEIKTEAFILKNTLDAKFTELWADIMSVIKKEDKKIKELGKAVKESDGISGKEYQRIFSMEPFPEVFPRAVE